jgi:hypothetical protein
VTNVGIDTTVYSVIVLTASRSMVAGPYFPQEFFAQRLPPLTPAQIAIMGHQDRQHAVETILFLAKHFLYFNRPT